MAIGDDDGAIYRWKLPGTSLDFRLRAETPCKIARAAVSPDGRWLARTGDGLVVHSMDDLDQVIVLDTHHDCDDPIAFAADGLSLSAVSHGRLKSWSTHDWSLVNGNPLPPGISAHSRLRDGTQLRWLRSWDSPSGQLSADESRLAMGKYDGNIDICDARSGVVQVTCIGPERPQSSA